MSFSEEILNLGGLSGAEPENQCTCQRGGDEVERWTWDGQGEISLRHP